MKALQKHIIDTISLLKISKANLRVLGLSDIE